MSRLISVGLVQAHHWFGVLRDRGIDITANAHVKAYKEAQEFRDDPSLEEGADVIIAVVGALWCRGHSLSDLGKAIIKKMAVNRTRDWKQLDDGTWQHV